jgi:hypothetical protein
MLNKALDYLKSVRKNLCNKAASIGDITLLKYAHQKGYLWDNWTSAYATN